MNKFKDGKPMYLVNSNDLIEPIILTKFNFYPLGWGYMKTSDNNLYAVTDSNLKNIYETKEEAEDSIYNLFSAVSF